MMSSGQKVNAELDTEVQMNERRERVIDEKETFVEMTLKI